MGTALYLCLRVFGLIDTGHDLVNICFLVSLDCIGLPALIALIRGEG